MREPKLIAKYRRDSESGMAVCTLQDSRGVRHTYQLGAFRSHESVVAHEKLVRRWKRSGRELPAHELSEEPDRLDPDEQLRRLTEAWPKLASETRGAVMFLCRLNDAIATQRRTGRLVECQ